MSQGQDWNAPGTDQGHPGSPYGQGYPQSPYGQPPAQPPYGQNGQGHPQSPYGQPPAQPPYGQNGQGHPGSPYGQGYPQPPYLANGQGYQQSPYGPYGPAYPQMPPAPAGYGMPGMPGAPGAPGMYVDPASGLVLPNGTTLASPGLRIGAYFLGLLLSLVCLILLGLPYLIWGAISWSKGQTPTQQILKTRYWNPNTRTTATWGTMALGQIIGRIVDYIAFGGIVSFIMLLVSADRRTLYDHICGCVVLHDPNNVLDPVNAMRALPR